jgi:hypothetical protein
MGSARSSQRRRWHRRGALTASGALLAAAVVVTAHSRVIQTDPAGVAADQASRFQAVSYLGHRFSVPAVWRVVDLSKHPATCVRFDMHAVYLGTPGAEQDCPARGVGRHIGALLIQPATATRGASLRSLAVERPASAEIDVSAPGVAITASYSVADRSAVLAALTSAHLASPATPPQVTPPQAVPSPAVPSRAAQPTATPSATGLPTSATAVISGLGFDACTAPAAGQMAAWTAPASPFTAIGVYIGGSERACAQPNLTAAWISAEARAGWRFMPLYAGWQAAWDSLTQTPPATLGQQSADDAAAQAQSLGFGPGSVLYYDMEAYTTKARRAAAMTFLSAWSSELHQKGYRAAAYSSANSGIVDLAANIGKMTEPDVIDIAHWNGNVDADPAATPAGTWPHLRVHQYQGGADATYGGVKINIDRDFFDLEVASP